MAPNLRLRATRLLKIAPAEFGAALWAFAYFFALLSSYYILRPVRDEMGILGGVENLQWLFTGTFLAMLAAVPLYGAAVRRFPRRRLLPVVYYFFIANLLAFFALFHSCLGEAWLARVFFIWVSVFNLFVVSVFWSFMADLFSNAQARRLFGFVAAGGSAGAIAGPAVTALLAGSVGTVNLLLISAALLGFAVFCIHRLLAWRNPEPGRSAPRGEPLGGSALAGFSLLLRSPYLLGIGLFILLYTTLSTFLYFEQAHIVRGAFAESADRTALFAAIDLAVNTLTIATQLFFTSRLVERLGLPATLALVPAFLVLGFAGLAAAPVLGMLVAVQVLRRAGNYAVTRPAREMLFTVVGREARYKAKSVIDTVVYRGGDALSGWAFAGLTAAGLGLSAIAWIGVPLAAIWLLVGVWLGRYQERLRTSPIDEAGPTPATAEDLPGSHRRSRP